MKSWRSPLWIKYPIGLRVGMSGDGKWDFKGRRLGRLGWIVQRDGSGRCLTIWCGPFAVWIARAA